MHSVYKPSDSVRHDLPSRGYINPYLLPPCFQTPNNFSKSRRGGGIAPFSVCMLGAGILNTKTKRRWEKVKAVARIYDIKQNLGSLKKCFLTSLSEII